MQEVVIEYLLATYRDEKAQASALPEDMEAVMDAWFEQIT